MICVRCGHCCHKLAVIIVDNPDLGISENNLIYHGGENKRCKHLKGLGIGNFSCRLHDYPWYKETPCYQHSQIERGDSICRIGEAVMNGKMRYL